MAVNKGRGCLKPHSLLLILAAALLAAGILADATGMLALLSLVAGLGFMIGLFLK
jgi:hypothetical protein